MNVLIKMGLIFGICLAGEAVSRILPFPFPGGVISMVILLVLLLTGAIRLRQVEEPTNFMVSNLLFFFIPACVGIVQYLDLIRDNIVALLTVCIVSTVLTFAVTAYAIRLVLWLQRRLMRTAGQAEKGHRV